MAAQKKLMDLQVLVETEDEWTSKVLAQPALSVVDVWPGWAGPCLAMRSHLIRLKLAEGGDDLHLFSVNASAVESLSARFAAHAEPTWLFLGGGELVHVYIGCSKPTLLRLVKKELRKEQRVLKGLAKRKPLPRDKLSAAERDRDAACAARESQAHQEEKDRADAALREVRLRQYRRLADHLNNYTVVLFLPHALEQGGLPPVAESLEDAWRAMGVHVAVTVRVCVSDEAADEIFWERRLPQHTALVDSLRANGGTCIAQLLRKGRAPAHPEYSPMEAAEEDSEAELDVDGDLGGQGDAPAAPRRRRQQVDEEEDEEEEEAEAAMRPGLLERLVAETVYGFYPGSAASTPLSVTRNDSLSEFFSPVGGTGSAGTPLQTSPLQSATTVGQFRRSTATWVRQSALSMRGLQPPAIREQDEDGDGQDEWDDHDLAEYEGCSLSYGSHFEQTWPKELRPVVDSAAAALLHRCSDTSLVLPGLWVPQTPLSKAAAVRVLFPAFALRFYEPEEAPAAPPAATVMCFRANKRGAVLDAAADFLDDIMHLGFFTEDRKLLAEAPAEYDALRVKDFRDLLVLAITTARSDEPLLELATYGTTYLSPTAKQARLDVQEFFGADVERAAPRVRGGRSEGEVVGEDGEDGEEEDDDDLPAPDPEPTQQGLLMLARTQAQNRGPPVRPPEPRGAQQSAPAKAASPVLAPPAPPAAPTPGEVPAAGPSAPSASRARASVASAGQQGRRRDSPAATATASAPRSRASLVGPREAGAGEGRRRDSPSAAASLVAASRASRELAGSAGSRAAGGSVASRTAGSGGGSRGSRTRSAAGTPPRLSGDSTRRASGTSSRGQLATVQEVAVDTPPARTASGRTASRAPSDLPARKSKSVLSVVASAATSATFVKVPEQLLQPESEEHAVASRAASRAASSVTVRAASHQSVPAAFSVTLRAVSEQSVPKASAVVADEPAPRQEQTAPVEPPPLPPAKKASVTSSDTMAMLRSLGK